MLSKMERDGRGVQGGRRAMEAYLAQIDGRWAHKDLLSLMMRCRDLTSAGSLKEAGDGVRLNISRLTDHQVGLIYETAVALRDEEMKR